jgi:hypothetical protein
MQFIQLGIFTPRTIGLAVMMVTEKLQGFAYGLEVRHWSENEWNRRTISI